MSAEAHEHDADCLCRVCHVRRRIACLLAPALVKPGGPDHPDHRVPECPVTLPPALGATATCRTCGRPITFEVVEEPGYLPRTGWSDGFRRDALVCFQAIDYRHIPTHAAWAVTS